MANVLPLTLTGTLPISSQFCGPVIPHTYAGRAAPNPQYLAPSYASSIFTSHSINLQFNPFSLKFMRKSKCLGIGAGFALVGCVDSRRLSVVFTLSNTISTPRLGLKYSSFKSLHSFQMSILRQL